MTEADSLDIETLYLRYRGAFTGIATRYVGKERAEDCVQRAFVKVVRFWSQCDKSKASSWAHSIVVREALTMLRIARPEGECVAIDETYRPQLTTASHERSVISQIDIARALPQIRPSQRAAIEMWMAGESGGKPHVLRRCRGIRALREKLAA